MLSCFPLNNRLQYRRGRHTTYPYNTMSDNAKNSRVDPEAIRPYGDKLDDGEIQVSFTLPITAGGEADEAARQVARKMGLEKPRIYHRKDLGETFTYFIVYGTFAETIDMTDIHVASVDAPERSFDEINEAIEERFGRKLTVLGACIGNDAHSVGIDAIMNMKGYKGEYGLERYPMIDARNLGMQIQCEELVKRRLQTDADAILVSQIVTQNNIHIDNLTQLIDMLEAEGIRDELVVICGGPRLSHELALELGYDAGFSSDTTARDVANFLVEEISKRESEGK